MIVKCRTREKGVIAPGIMIVSVEPGRRGLLSLGIMILSVESGRWGSVVNNDCKYRTREKGVIVSRQWRI